MSNRATAKFAVKTWDEKPYEELVNGVKFTRASVTKEYEGDIQGEGVLEYVMYYREDNTGMCCGLERINGAIGGRSGAFVLQYNDVFDPQAVNSSYTVVENSGTGDLQGLQGEGAAVLSGHHEKYTMSLDYTWG